MTNKPKHSVAIIEVESNDRAGTLRGEVELASLLDQGYVIAAVTTVDQYLYYTMVQTPRAASDDMFRTSYERAKGVGK